MFIAIHQPNFLPWLGFFHKLSQVDEFIFFDNVPTGQGKSWLSRNRINLHGVAVWLTVPIQKGNRAGQPIKDVEIDYQQPWIRKHLGTLFQAYYHSPFYEAVFPQIEKVYRSNYRFLADFNIALIKEIAHILGLNRRYYRASERVSLNKLKTEMIVQVCISFNCRKYLTGLGCLNFLEPDLFQDAGIELVYQKFQHPTYEHPGSVFLSNMSALDPIFCLGPELVREHLLQQTDFYYSMAEFKHVAD
jgi:hypothetical protein